MSAWVPTAARARSLTAPLLAAALLVELIGQLHLALSRSSEAELQRTFERVEAEARSLAVSVAATAQRVAALPAARRVLGGEPAARAPLFARLEQIRAETPGQPALGVHASAAQTLAWTGPVSDAAALHAVRRAAPLFVVEGSVSTVLVATAPIRTASGVLGLASAELTLSVRRHIRNEFLRDYDRLADVAPGVDVAYLDVSDEAPHPLPPLEPGLAAYTGLVSAPGGEPLAAVRVRGSPAMERDRALLGAYRRVESLLLLLLLARWTLVAPRASPRLALGATLALATVTLFGPPLPPPGSALLSPGIYASSRLGPLLGSPLQLLLAALVLLLVSVLAARSVSSGSRRARGPLGTLALDALALLPMLAVFEFLAETLENCTLELETIGIVPQSAALAVVQSALLLVLASGAAALVAVFAFAGPRPGASRAWLARGAGWLGLGALVALTWPSGHMPPPALPAAALYVGSALAAGLAPRAFTRLSRLGPGRRALLLVGSVALFAVLLQPSLAHYAEASLEHQIEHEHAKLVLRQPAWRRYVLDETRRRLDGLDLLEEAGSGPHPPGLGELAFAAWSATDLAAFGFSSAVEIQDASGVVISRFALNLPTLSGPRQTLPESADWRVSEERLPLGASERPVLHARRQVARGGLVYGAVHVYVADDFWNLPFLTGRDPYSVLFRSAPRAASRARPLGLAAYEGRSLVFSSSDRPSPLGPELTARLASSPGGFWTTLPFDGQPQRAYLFADGRSAYGLFYPRLGAARRAADLAEAVLGLALLALLSLVAVVGARSLLRRDTLSFASFVEAVRRRFALRLFLAFVLLAVAPAAVLQLLVRGFVAGRLQSETRAQALERASIARKAVEDFAFFQAGAAPGEDPVTDAALVWVARLVRNDVDLFDRGRLRASSKRELYASGLLSPRAPADVYRELVLGGEPALLREESIGELSYLAVSVPVDLRSAEPGVLTLPMATWQREVELALEELDRRMRLASALFLLVAAGLSFSISHRLFRPIRQLTLATGRVARGDLTARVEPTSRDELRDLVLSFNRMAEDLARQRADIERSNRLAAWAEMARQVAHEVKNPLTPIQLSAEHLKRVYRDPGADFARALEGCTETILKQVRILRGIVTEFSAFARPPGSEVERLDLGELVAGLLEPYQVALPPQVRLALARDEPLPAVRGERRLLERAIVNLVENALQAVADAGSIVVRVAARDGGVEISVEDSGPGFEPEAAARAFEPFFSTKTSGSGLGLALVKKIAEDHAGRVELSGTGPGPTRALLWLPAEAPPDAEPPRG